MIIDNCRSVIFFGFNLWEFGSKNSLLILECHPGRIAECPRKTTFQKQWMKWNADEWNTMSPSWHGLSSKSLHRMPWWNVWGSSDFAVEESAWPHRWGWFLELAITGSLKDIIGCVLRECYRFLDIIWQVWTSVLLLREDGRRRFLKPRSVLWFDRWTH